MTDRQFNPQEALDFAEKLKILSDINAELSRSASFDDLCRRAVELGRQRLEFDRLSLWFFDEDPDYILGAFGTDENGQTRDERGYRVKPVLDETVIAAFERRDTRALRRDASLTDHRGQAVGRGENALGILWDGEHRLGWLSADNYIHGAHIADSQVELLGLYSTAIGHLLTRKRAEDELQRREQAALEFQEKLKALHDVTIELSKTRSFDDLCRRAVQLGRERLGFDRLGLWFFDTDPDYMIGSFGIDESGNIRDERQQRIPSAFGQMVEALGGRVLTSAELNVPLYNDRQGVVGYGWNAAARVWDGDRNIGWLSADNLFSGQPRTEFVLELLALYAATLGHLTALRKFEEALTAERNLFRVIIDTVPDLIFVKDAEGRFVMGNRAWQQTLPGEAPANDMIGKTDYELGPADLAERYRVDDQKVISSGQRLVNIEEPGAPRGDDPGQRLLLTTKVPFRDAQGNITGLVGVARDITELRETERKAMELAVEHERVSAFKEFIANISHDFRTPLSVIKSSLYLLERMADPQQRRDRIDAIKRQVTLLDRFVEEIVLSARLEKQLDSSAQPINLNGLLMVIEERLRPAAEEKSLNLETEFQPALPQVLGDDTDLNRAFSNLVQNAIHYTPDGGTITLRTRTSDGKVIAEVADTGIGISEADLPRIFDHFYRVDKARAIDKGGMGLGLAIAKRIVEIHSGTIQVESTVGKGTLFRITLPAYSDRTAQ